MRENFDDRLIVETSPAQTPQVGITDLSTTFHDLQRKLERCLAVCGSELCPACASASSFVARSCFASQRGVSRETVFARVAIGDCDRELLF